MTESQVSIRELQREASRVVRAVEQDKTTYRVTVAGRPTAVVLAPGTPPRPAGASRGDLEGSRLYRAIAPEVADAWVERLAAERERAGRVGGQP